MKETEKIGDLGGQAELKLPSSPTREEGNVVEDLKDLWIDAVEAQLMNILSLLSFCVKDMVSSDVRSKTFKFKTVTKV